jgi:hypothetical protein
MSIVMVMVCDFVVSAVDVAVINRVVAPLALILVPCTGLPVPAEFVATFQVTVVIGS